MLYYKDLSSLVFENYPHQADEVKILSGYIGPVPLAKLKSLPIKSTVIHGLFKENRKKKLHDQVVKLHGDNLEVFYPEILSHSKCYIWLKDGVPIKGLIGSANFSSNGLNSDYRETLFEVDVRQATMLNAYIDVILNSAKACIEFDVEDKGFTQSLSGQRLAELKENYVEGVAELSLVKNNGEIHQRSGLNWGMSEDSNVRPNDAYIPIRIDTIRLHPDIFTPRQELPEGVSARTNVAEVVELIWDDGEVMQARFEGTQLIPDLGPGKYPKNLASFPNKDILGRYMRKRLGVEPGTPVTLSDLERYGSQSIKLSKIEDGIYSADFRP